MADLRSVFRRNIPEDKNIRMLARGGDEVLGAVLDINQKGFRLDNEARFKPGAMLEGLIEFSDGGALPRQIPITAQAVWNEGGETGFTIKEIPLAEEDTLDRLIAIAEGRA